MSFLRRLLQAVALLMVAGLLSGCDLLVLDPAGDIAARQGDLIVVATLLMLIVIVPVIALTFWFAWRYRASNRTATYTPDWDHSTQLELVIWGVPLLIIIALGAVTWISTHLLDPYRPLDRIAAGRPLPADTKPLEIQVVALDWKWLFVYPEQGIASVNEVAVPVDRPVHFRITASSVMNTFYVPALAGMIYGMPGMESNLNAVINAPGEYEGFSANYSGAGFSHMRFKFHGMADADFARWVQGVRGGDGALTRAAYLELEKPSKRDAVRHFASVDKGLYDAILNRCVDTERLCMNQMMALDAAGGLGLDGLNALAMPRRGDPRLGPYVSAQVCIAPQPGRPLLSSALGGMQAP
jgi:cytochrome o ubiquinol oxidase subunit II